MNDEDLIDLFKDLNKLGIGDGRVTIYVTFLTRGEEIKYTITFPSIDNSVDKIRDTDIAVLLSKGKFNITPIKSLYEKSMIINKLANYYYSYKGLISYGDGILSSYLNKAFNRYKEILEIKLIIDLEERLFLKK